MKKIVNMKQVYIICLVFSVGLLITINIVSSFSGQGNASAYMYGENVKKQTADITAGCNSEMEKASAIYEWITDNFTYDHNYTKIIQTVSNEQTIKTHKGICLDLSALYAAMCHEAGVKCYLVDAQEIGNNKYHTWNRLYLDGEWYDVDITNDISSENKLGFMGLDDGKETKTIGYQIERIY